MKKLRSSLPLYVTILTVFVLALLVGVSAYGAANHSFGTSIAIGPFPGCDDCVAVAIGPFPGCDDCVAVAIGPFPGCDDCVASTRV